MLDSNFLLVQNGRPIVLHKELADWLHTSLNNDSNCLANANRIDYSLLAIVNESSKTIRFGIIDYLQMYNFNRFVESKFKRAINLGTRPTIIDPKSYAERFCTFSANYLVGIDSQHAS